VENSRQGKSTIFKNEITNRRHQEVLWEKEKGKSVERAHQGGGGVKKIEVETCVGEAKRWERDKVTAAPSKKNPAKIFL